MSCLLEDAYIIEYLHVFISKQIGCVSHRHVNSLLIKKNIKYAGNYRQINVGSCRLPIVLENCVKKRNDGLQALPLRNVRFSALRNRGYF